MEQILKELIGTYDSKVSALEAEYRAERNALEPVYILHRSLVSHALHSSLVEADYRLRVERLTKIKSDLQAARNALEVAKSVYAEYMHTSGTIQEILGKFFEEFPLAP